ncbi:hypothetical protein CTA1_7617 [Colletotrichum tanaceti]|uniref:Uncharacterized protein n=1 Tax=Colletotrichum tanaceti TaxID=1306861 RepID=A0A4U6XR88_9PEZI|nr:hypothetical protein CTA1_7617 [Colletotrichum tanaceti]
MTNDQATRGLHDLIRVILVQRSPVGPPSAWRSMNPSPEEGRIYQHRRDRHPRRRPAAVRARGLRRPTGPLLAPRPDEAELAGLSRVSVVQMASLTLVPAWGAAPWGRVVLVLPFLFIKVYPSSSGVPGVPGVPGIPRISPATQLSLIAALTAAAAAGTICSSAALTNTQQVPVIVVSYLLIGAGLSLALALDVLF